MPVLSPEKIALLHARALEYFDGVEASRARVRAEGNTVLQWLFGVIVGSLGIIGPVYTAGYSALAVALLCASAWASYIAARLIKNLGMTEGNTKYTGYKDEVRMLGNVSLDDFKLAQVVSLEGAGTKNGIGVFNMADGIERAREALTKTPAVVFSGFCLAWVATHLPQIANIGLQLWGEIRHGSLAAVGISSLAVGLLVALRRVCVWLYDHIISWHPKVRERAIPPAITSGVRLSVPRVELIVEFLHCGPLPCPMHPRYFIAPDSFTKTGPMRWEESGPTLIQCEFVGPITPAFSSCSSVLRFSSGAIGRRKKTGAA